MLKKTIKQIVKKIIKLIHLRQILDEIRQDEDIKAKSSVFSHNGATFYTDSSFINQQNDKNKINVGKGTHIRGQLHIFKYGGEISIGKDCYIGDHTRIWSGEKVRIGDYVQISHNVNIMDTNAHELDSIERTDRYIELVSKGPWEKKGNITTAPITIEDYVWIGFNTTVLKGVTIGKGSIIGANSVITKDVAPYTLMVGNPAKAIKELK